MYSRILLALLFCCSLARAATYSTLFVNYGNKNLHFQLAEVAKDKDTVGVVLVIYYDEGSFYEWSLVHDMVKAIARHKPVVACFYGSADSPAYLVASVAHYVVAPRATKFCMENLRKFLGKNSEEALKKNPEIFAQEEVEQTSKKYYDFFKDTVAANRGIAGNSALWVEDKIFFGKEIKTLGLVDEFGSCFEAEEKLCEIINQREATTD